MTTLHLDLHADAYTLRLDDGVLARLEGGAGALLPDRGGPLGEADLEGAIERAEDWLMPSSRRVQGLVLRVHGADESLRAMLAGLNELTLAQVEAAFDRAHDAVVRGRASDREGVAAVVLLRELAHHGMPGRISIG